MTFSSEVENCLWFFNLCASQNTYQTMKNRSMTQSMNGTDCYVKAQQ